MILKCFDGPMDGAIYALSRETADPQQRSTNRKPDGLWFDGVDEHGRNVQHQYAGGNAMPLVDCKEPVVLEYRYSAELLQRGRERAMDALREARLASVIDPPVFHQAEINKWLSANEKTAAQVQHSLFPIGMVQRWIERAEQAETNLCMAESQCEQLERDADQIKTANIDLRGTVNLLADKLARHTGRTVPDEIRRVREEIASGIPHGDPAGEDEVGSVDPAGKPTHDWCANDMCPICNQRHAEELLKP